jgi:hypothetical protein
MTWRYSTFPGWKNFKHTKSCAEFDRDDWIYVEPTEEHTYTIIFLGGFTDSASTNLNLFEEGGPLYSPNLRVVLAQGLPYKENDGKYLPVGLNSWFDIIIQPPKLFENK